MAAIDLPNRTTNEWEIIIQQKQDLESKLFVSGKPIWKEAI